VSTGIEHTRAGANRLSGKLGQNREAEPRDSKTNSRNGNSRAFTLLTARPVPVKGTNSPNSPTAAITDKRVFPTLSNSDIRNLLFIQGCSEQGSVFFCL